MNVVVLI